jgi:Uma2 family endonuclease
MGLSHGYTERGQRVAVEQEVPMTVATPELMLRSTANDWTLARWETLPADGNRYEVLDGMLYMSTVPSTFHQWVSQRLFFFLHDELGVKRGGFVFFAQFALVMAGADPAQPDLLYAHATDRGIFRHGRVQGIPALLVEIASPVSEGLDLTTRRAIYAGAGVPEYWVLRLATRDLVLLSDPDPLAREYRSDVLVPADGALISPTLPLRAPIARFFADAPDTTL